ncbi:MAG: helix-turn-helix transcriptional regulator [Firmicutes bacterium]|nr:helix-turn-helix transcriptional regulator [Bacillota bacterium]
MDHIRNKIGSRLRLLRLERELTQEQLAGKAGFHPTYIAKIETGRRLPSLEVIEQLAFSLNVPAAYIVQAIDDPSPAIAAAGSDFEEALVLLRSCRPGQIRFIREVIKLVKRHDVFDPPE